MDILVADDSMTTLALLTASLKKLGHSVIAAHNGREAIDLFSIKKPDLIILDVVMNEMDGFECAKQIRTIRSDDWIPIIFLSASVDDNSIAQGINAGGDDYLTKPYSEITLAAKIQAMQRISEMRKKMYDTTQELKMLSSTDPLTGLYNRLEFEKRIQEKIAEADRYGLKLAVLFIDIDHFKTVNDSLGHHMGDLLLKEVAKRLKASLRIEDFVARLGGCCKKLGDKFKQCVSLADPKH
jgi:PleD family two-component response regulator